MELILVVGLLSVLAFIAMPNFLTPLARTHLPESARQFRSLIEITRANAMLDSLRYRIRFLQEGEEAAATLSAKERMQPYVEAERDPIEYPGQYSPVKASWATSDVFLGDVWCYQVRLGEPTFEDVATELAEQEELEDEEQLKEELGIEEEDPWVLVLEPDGTSEWMTFRLIDTPTEDFDEQYLNEYKQIDVIVDGRLGMVFLQRPLNEDEMNVLMDKGHSPILRRDFLKSRPLTEDDVIEIDMRNQ